MAQREAGASPRKNKAAKKKTAKKAAKSTKGKPAESDNVVTLSNFRQPTKTDTDLFVKYAKMAEAQDKVITKRMSDLQTEKQALGDIYRQAKEAGLSVERVRILKATIKERKRDVAEILTEERERAFQHHALKSELAEVLPFSSLLAPPSLKEIEMQGEHAGKNGEPRDNNPWTPGTPQHVHWTSGHKKGQRSSANTVFNGGDGGGKPASDEGGEGDGAQRMDV